jgi:glycosyltransferase involved in cell wall biosynthesis
MRVPSEHVDSAVQPAGPLGTTWRLETAKAQEKGLPSGGTTVSCSAPYGMGGLGRHLKEVVDALGRSGRPVTRICGSTRAAASASERDMSPRHVLAIPYLKAVLPLLPVPASPGWRTRAFMVEFDAYAARRLPAADHLIAFNGQALKQVRAAKRARYKSVSLVSANSHLRRVVRQHARAHRQYSLEGSWATHLVNRNVMEYARVDRIYVGSRYTLESFLEEGFEDEKLALFPFTPDPRYQPSVEPPTTGTFDIVFIGGLTVAKGVPLLIDAVRRLPHRDMRLVLVGGWATRGMRRFIQKAIADDGRISVHPGDPLPYLRDARLCVHPTYEDGFGYAPAEALACGVPVIVSEDTGMKDLIDPGDNGVILPTGDLPALTEAIEAAYRGEIVAS